MENKALKNWTLIPDFFKIIPTSENHANLIIELQNLINRSYLQIVAKSGALIHSLKHFNNIV